jgi:hypothetical protein
VDRRAVDPEPTGGLAFGNALLYGLYYLGTQIYGVGIHLPMMLGDATSLQAAVGQRFEAARRLSIFPAKPMKN